MKPILFILSLFFLVSCDNKISQSKHWIASAPAGDQYCFIKSNEAILPNGRFVRPMGRTTRIAPHPYGLVLSKDGTLAATANSGTNPFSISVIHHPFTDSMTVMQIPNKPKTDDDLLSAVFMGLAISSDNQSIYVAGGQTNKIFVFDTKSGNKLREISCHSNQKGFDYNDGYIGDMVMSHDGKKLYAVDQIGYRIIEVDLASFQIINQWHTGRYPFGITLSPDDTRMYVANVGMFQYSYVNHMDSTNLKSKPLDFPAFAYGTDAMKNGIDTGSTHVSGLGDMNSDDAFSVWAYDLKSVKDQALSKTKTGFLVGDKIDGIPAVGGSSPNSIVATDKYVFVSNGSNDCISVLDAATNTLIKNIPLMLDERLGHLKGMIPFGLALDHDQKNLFVAESGINAVGIIDLNTMTLKGHLPVGWFPSKLQVSPDNKKLIVANAKGFGSGPNGGAHYTKGPEGDYIGSLMKGSVTVLDIPANGQLNQYTDQVIANNFNWNDRSSDLKKTTLNSPVPLAYDSKEKSPIKYLVFIAKENRTYDEIYGQLSKGNGDPALARYGHHVRFKNKRKTDSLQDRTIMPNHLALAKRFSISDNFYVDSDHSADGHRWLASTYPNEWLETHTSAAYGGKRDLSPTSNAPGRFGMTGASGAIYPEDYNQHGSLWDHLVRNKKEFFNFGFGVEFDNGSFSDTSFKYGGVKYLVNYPLPGPLYDRTSRKYATFNMAIPDQFRIDVFIQEFNEKWGDGKSLPSVLTMSLPNDHGAGERAYAGFPYRESYMADNDLALGRLVEFLSHTPYWKEMAIIITEDDSQDGRDHIDAHRSILTIVSPYAKKDYVSHVHNSFGSIFKTMFNVLSIPYLNQYDGGATDLADCFTAQPDFTPYQAMMVDTMIFNPRTAMSPIKEGFDWKALSTGPDLDDEGFIRKSMKEK
jgi:YVTN family beta-propeller protein